ILGHGLASLARQTCGNIRVSPGCSAVRLDCTCAGPSLVVDGPGSVYCRTEISLCLTKWIPHYSRSRRLQTSAVVRECCLGLWESKESLAIECACRVSNPDCSLGRAASYPWTTGAHSVA